MESPIKKAPARRDYFNLTLRGELKPAALEFARRQGYGLSALIERWLEWKTFRAGLYRPPWLDEGLDLQDLEGASAEPKKPRRKPNG